MTTALKHKDSGEIVVPTPGSDYEKKLLASQEWSEVSPEEFAKITGRKRDEAAKAEQAETDATRATSAAAAGETTEGTDAKATSKSSGKSS